MRLAGRITEWNDDKGYGFVAPNGGGDRAFVHIRAFQRDSKRPVAGDLISYLPARDQRGRLNASDIRHAGQKISAPRKPSRLPRTALGVAALAFAAGLAAAGIIPVVLVGALAGLSAVAYVMYWLDKSAAQSSRPRIAETTLHLVALAGGWPGALIAQQQFRHKTIKQPFQSVFWGTIAVNLAVILWLASSGISWHFARSLSG